MALVIECLFKKIIEDSNLLSHVSTQPWKFRVKYSPSFLDLELTVILSEAAIIALKNIIVLPQSYASEQVNLKQNMR